MLNYAQLSHAFAKTILGNNFDTLLKIVKGSGNIADLPATMAVVWS